MQLSYLAVTLLAATSSCFGDFCRLSIDHKNYTCNGFRLRQFGVSRKIRPQILRIRISNCKTTGIEEEALKFPSLEVAELSCGIETLHENAFGNLNSLRQLNLSNNAISVLPDRLFRSLAKVEMLNFSRNNFEELTKTMFDGLNNLKVLSLSHNIISRLDYKSLSKLTRLEKIYLNNNNLQVIPNTFFNQLGKLQLIDLSYNNIQTIDSLFVSTPGLNYLNVSHNAIKDLAQRIFQITKLEILDLSYNELTVVYEDSLKLDTLRELYVQDNRISMFDVKRVGANRFPLSFLDLRDNRIVFLEEDFIKSTRNLVTIKVAGNPWDCKCYERMEKLGGEIYFDVNSEKLGNLHLCVFGTTDDCNVDKNDLASYYNLYQEQLELEPRK